MGLKGEVINSEMRKCGNEGLPLRPRKLGHLPYTGEEHFGSDGESDKFGNEGLPLRHAARDTSPIQGRSTLGLKGEVISGVPMSSSASI